MLSFPSATKEIDKEMPTGILAPNKLQPELLGT
jgi:hypothetical protein